MEYWKQDKNLFPHKQKFPGKIYLVLYTQKQFIVCSQKLHWFAMTAKLQNLLMMIFCIVFPQLPIVKQHYSGSDDPNTFCILCSAPHLSLYIPYCSVLTASLGVAAPSPRLDLAATQTWYRVLGYRFSRIYSVVPGSSIVLWLANF